MQTVWEMLSDQKIWSLLGDIDKEINQDSVRLMLIEFFSRIKKLEEENLALRVLLMEDEIIDPQEFNCIKNVVKDFLQQKDEQNTMESNFFAKSGVSFPEYVSFKLNGRFHK